MVNSVYFWMHICIKLHKHINGTGILKFCFQQLLILSLQLSRNLGISVASQSHSVSPFICSVNEYLVIPHPPLLAAIGVRSVVYSGLWRPGSGSQSPLLNRNSTCSRYQRSQSFRGWTWSLEAFCWTSDTGTWLVDERGHSRLVQISADRFWPLLVFPLHIRGLSKSSARFCTWTRQPSLRKY